MLLHHHHRKLHLLQLSSSKNRNPILVALLLLQFAALFVSSRPSSMPSSFLCFLTLPPMSPASSQIMKVRGSNTVLQLTQLQLQLFRRPLSQTQACSITALIFAMETTRTPPPQLDHSSKIQCVKTLVLKGFN